MQESRRRPLRPSLVVAAVAALTATGAVNAGCSSEPDDQYVNCVDEDGEVVDPDRCEDDGGRHYSGFYYFPSHKKYRIGSKAPSNWKSSRVNPADTAARSRAGLPSSGKIGGTTVHSGGFGGGSGKTGGS
jgi:hypothetical protein